MGKVKAQSPMWPLAAAVVVAAFLAGLMSRRTVELGSPAPGTGQSLVAQGLVASSLDKVEIPESEYFGEMVRVLERLYVDGVKDEDALVAGAIRGMVASLADPSSSFYNKEQMLALEGRLQGKYDGIGAELSLEFDQAELSKLQNRSRDIDGLLLLPSLRVTAVMPGSPAEKAGMRAGDVIREIEGRALVSADDIKEIRALQKAASEGKVSNTEIEKQREEFRKRADENLTAQRAREKLTTGVDGALNVKWRRPGQKDEVSARVSRQRTNVQPLIKNSDGSYMVRFIKGLPEAMQAQGLAGKDLVLDLRNSGMGDLGVLKRVLGQVSAPGPFGRLATERPGEARRLMVEPGIAKPGRLRLKVDSSVSGAAEIFALAVSQRGQGQLDGTKMAGSTAWTEVMVGPEGTGYTLTTGIFRPLTGAAK